MQYRCVTTSVEGFVQQLAVAYISHGYWFYVTGTVPEGKDPAAVDAKLIERYGIAISKWVRCRRKKQGLANMQYLRHERFFMLLATKGCHEFFERERASFRDVRRVPIKFGGYSIGCRRGMDGRWHASVRVLREQHADLKALLVDIGLRRGAEAVAHEFARLQFQPFAPVKRQMLEALRAVNRATRTAGIGVVTADCLPLRRRVNKPFDERGAESASEGFANL